ncbi:MAG: zinc ribbon domain-containing protein [Oscillospiraceae bacterium]|nr:zinc ribbon domain-containing protein [Oscillospiraceae bacterium]MBQ7119164.1 zinc ribbon domain-containing protein [Oscillospiraceae bacterium]
MSISNLNKTPDTTMEFDSHDIEQNKAMAILAYLGILVLIPIFAAPQSKFARYHANQGLILAIIEVIYGFAYFVLSFLLFSILPWRMWGLATFLLGIVGLAGIIFLALLIIGIMNASQGKAKELPVIGKYRILK